MFVQVPEHDSGLEYAETAVARNANGATRREKSMFAMNTEQKDCKCVLPTDTLEMRCLEVYIKLLGRLFPPPDSCETTSLPACHYVFLVPRCSPGRNETLRRCPSAVLNTGSVRPISPD